MSSCSCRSLPSSLDVSDLGNSTITLDMDDFPPLPLFAISFVGTGALGMWGLVQGRGTGAAQRKFNESTVRRGRVEWPNVIEARATSEKVFAVAVWGFWVVSAVVQLLR